MSNPNLPQQSRASLRRKPPPSMDDRPRSSGPDASTFPTPYGGGSSVLPRMNSQTNTDSYNGLPPRSETGSRYVNAPIDPVLLSNLVLLSTSVLQSNSGLRLSDDRQDPGNSTYDEEFFTYGTPRPMGPKQLPFDEYNDAAFEPAAYDTSAHSEWGEVSYLDAPNVQLGLPSPNLLINSSRDKYRVRKYQNLLQSGTSPLGLDIPSPSHVPSYERDASNLPEATAPYPVSDSPFASDLSTYGDNVEHSASREYSEDYSRVGNYGNESYGNENYGNYTESAEYGLDNSRQYGGYDTRFRDDSDDYYPSPNNTVDYAANISTISADYTAPGFHDTPVRIPTLVDDRALSPENRPYSSGEYNFFRNSRYSSSPELGPATYMLNSPTRTRPYTYSDQVNDSRSSRSPSPRKSSPRSSFYPTDDILEDLFDEDYRTPRWSTLENDMDAYSELVTPLTSNFDYDNLPELPRLEDTPNRNMTLKSTMSLFKKDDIPQMSSSTHKRNDSLPPVPLDLPLLPFSSSSLTRLHFAVCTNVWSMKDIFSWCVKLSGWLHDQEISHKEFRKALIKLVVYHKRHIPINLIGKNITQIIASLSVAGAIVITSKDGAANEKLVTIVPKVEISGVLVDLTDCYCRDDEHVPLAFNGMPWKCYSSQCLINKMIDHEHLMKNTNPLDLELKGDWASYWQLTAEDVNMDPAISKRQSLIFDLIKFEQNFIQRATCFIEVAAPHFISAATSIGPDAVGAGKLRDEICVPAKELADIHRTLLYEPLVRILITDGRLVSNIVGIAGLYEEWSKKARDPLLSYMSTVPMIEDLLRKDSLKEWDQAIRQNARMKELQVNGNLLLMSTFNSRYQQLPLQLSDIRKSFDEQEEEYILLTKAIEDIKKLGSKVNEMKVHADNIHALRVLGRQLTWKSNIHQPNINLSSEKRRLFYRGDLARRGDLKINSHSVHLIVLDNYFLITERSRSQRALHFKVVETPIPTDFLIVENRDKETGIVSKVGTSPNTTKQPDIEDELASYPFKIRYAGRGKYQSYTFLAPTEKDRNRWLGVFEKARSNLLRRVLPLAPYKLQLIDNSFFAYEYPNRITKLPLLPVNDPVLQLSGGTTTNLKNRGITRDIYSPDVPRNLLVYKKVLCAEVFESSGTEFYFLGLNLGVYCSDMKNRWKMIINMSNVTKMSVLPSLNVVLVLANKQLRYYSLQLLIDIYYEHKEKTSSFQLSNDSILFYEVGRHRGVPMLFVAKKKTAGTTTFKVFSIETDNNGILSTFSVVKRFYIQAECYGISVFNTSVSVHTQRGFEILDLEKLVPRTVPELPPPEPTSRKIDSYGRKNEIKGVEAIRRAIGHSTVKPMGMFKLANNKEFLLVYNECAILVNKSGKLSRNSIIRFDFRPRSIAFSENNLFLVCEEVIEVWSISDFAQGTNKLIEVVPSKDILLLSAQHLCFNMANPRVTGLQMIFCLQSKASEGKIIGKPSGL